MNNTCSECCGDRGNTTYRRPGPALLVGLNETCLPLYSVVYHLFFPNPLRLRNSQIIPLRLACFFFVGSGYWGLCVIGKQHFVLRVSGALPPPLGIFTCSNQLLKSSAQQHPSQFRLHISGSHFSCWAPQVSTSHPAENIRQQ